MRDYGGSANVPILLIGIGCFVILFISATNHRNTSILGAAKIEGTDITNTGGSNLGDDHGPSWIVGDHRKPMWSQSQTYSIGGLEPYNDLYRRLALRKLDRGHFFQQDTNPWQDKRMVLDPTSPDDFPWDPSVMCWDTRDAPEVGQGGTFHPLTPGCFKRQPRPPPRPLRLRGLSGPDAHRVRAWTASGSGRIMARAEPRRSADPRRGLLQARGADRA